MGERNPYHDKVGRFSSGPAFGHNAGEGNRKIAAHIKVDHDDAPKTLKEASRHISSLGLALKKSDGEYRVNFKKGREATAYYTNDLSDAVHTGRHMAKHGRR